MQRLERYIGAVADVIYMDRNQHITQRRVIIRSCKDDLVLEVFCLERREPRSFRVDRILAVRTKQEQTF
jgi:predicted DNA-binding transcriptional regulator YafY